MENEYENALENYDSEYVTENYSDNAALSSLNNYQGAVVQQPVYVQTQQIAGQPIFTQPIYTQPVVAQPIYTQPVYMQAPIAPMATPIPPVQPDRGYFPADELKAVRWHAHPVLVFFALILCFPVGLILLLFFTKWGVFPKIFIVLFSFICIWFIYEVLAFYSIFDLPSLLNNIF